MPQQVQHPVGTANWYDLSTNKPEESKAFYSALFGWTFHDQGPEYGHYHQAKQNGHTVAGFMAQTPDMQGMPSLWTVYFRTLDAQADAGRIQELGGNVMVPPMPVHTLGQMMVAIDPTGAAFGLWQPGEFQGSELANEHGSMAWQEVLTRDAGAARDFYTALLNSTTEKLPGDMTYYTLHQGSDTVGGIMQMDDGHWPASIPPHWMPYFAVNDIQDAVKIAAEHGGTVNVPPFESPYGLVSILSDPAGAVFSVIQLTQME